MTHVAHRARFLVFPAFAALLMIAGCHRDPPMVDKAQWDKAMHDAKEKLTPATPLDPRDPGVAMALAPLSETAPAGGFDLLVESTPVTDATGAWQLQQRPKCAQEPGARICTAKLVQQRASGSATIELQFYGKDEKAADMFYDFDEKYSGGGETNNSIQGPLECHQAMEGAAPAYCFMLVTPRIGVFSVVDAGTSIPAGSARFDADSSRATEVARIGLSWLQAVRSKVPAR